MLHFFLSSLTTAVAARHRQDIPNDTSVVHKNCIHGLKNLEEDWKRVAKPLVK